jgi:hypothetical protein
MTFLRSMNREEAAYTAACLFLIAIIIGSAA